MITLKNLSPEVTARMSGFHTGLTWYVDNSGNNKASLGTKNVIPFSTIAKALEHCVNDRGDVIVVGPDHNETVGSAGGLTVNKDGVSIIGMGGRTTRPKITLDTLATASVDVTGADVTIDSVEFVAGFADIAECLNVSGVGLTLRNCLFHEPTADLNFLICVLGLGTTVSDFLTLENCEFRTLDAANTHGISLPGTTKGVVIRDCFLHGNWGTAAIGAAGNVTQCLVENNRIYNAATDVNSCINLASGATGVVAKNLVGNAAAQANQITAQGCVLAQNYGAVVVEDLSGILEPIAT